MNTREMEARGRDRERESLREDEPLFSLEGGLWRIAAEICERLERIAEALERHNTHVIDGE